MAMEVAVAAGHSDVALMPPPRSRGTPLPRRPEPLVLEEDEWATQLETIIERDFFPDVPKLQSKLEWLQALRSRDPAALRQAQANIAQRRAGIRTPIGATPGTFETPGASLLRAPHLATPSQTPAMTPLMGRYGGVIPGHSNPGDPEPNAAAGNRTNDDTGPLGGAIPGRGDPQDSDPAQQPATAPIMTLDRFLAKHTSEDNASFAELLKDMNERRKQVAPWLHRPHVQAPLLLEDSVAQEERPSDGYGTGGQGPMRLLVVGHEPKNRLYYDSSQHDALALSPAELAARVAGPPKAIRHRATRFIGSAMPPSGASTPGGSNSNAGAAADSEAAELQQQYGMLATPSFTPGADGESPFMTWGDVASTPLRLDAEDTPLDIDGGAGPKFRMQEVPRKERVTRHMAAKASSSLKRKAASHAGTPLARQVAAAASARTGGRMAGGNTPLSQAGRRLASSMRAAGRAPARDAADAQLRASYRPATPSTPSGRGVSASPAVGSGGASATPVVGSSEASRLARLRQVALDNKRRKEEGRPGGKLTDDLLDI